MEEDIYRLILCMPTSNLLIYIIACKKMSAGNILWFKSVTIDIFRSVKKISAGKYILAKIIKNYKNCL